MKILTSDRFVTVGNILMDILVAIKDARSLDRTDKFSNLQILFLRIEFMKTLEVELFRECIYDLLMELGGFEDLDEIQEFLKVVYPFERRVENTLRLVKNRIFKDINEEDYTFISDNCKFMYKDPSAIMTEAFFQLSRIYDLSDGISYAKLFDS